MLIASNKDRIGYKESIALVDALKDCTLQKNLCNGSKLHASVLKRGLVEDSVFVSSSLVNMYSKCGALAKAQIVFDDILIRNVVSWNTLITAYAQHNQVTKALLCSEQMRGEGIPVNSVTFTALLKACGTLGCVERGLEIHNEITKQGLLCQTATLGTALLDMYSKCGDLVKAREVFDRLPSRDVISWNALIAGYTQHNQSNEAIDCFERMQCEGFSPNVTTLACVLRACGSLRAIDRGKHIHDQIIGTGLLTKSVVLGNALIDMYAKCGMISNALEVFENLPSHDVVSWTAIISGCCQHGRAEQALQCFKNMQKEGLYPSPVTLVCVLQACSYLKALEVGVKVHSEIARGDLLGNLVSLGNALVNMYGKCGVLARAQEVFDRFTLRDNLTWTTLITAYCQHGLVEEALNCLNRMQDEGFFADGILFASVLQACSSLGAIQKGEFLHAEIVRKGFLSSDTVLGTILMDFYAKCSALAKTQKIFEELPLRSVVTWNVLIGAYAEVGKHESVFEMLNRMTREAVWPDMVTFVVILNVCSCVGLVGKGQMLFEMMTSRYNIVPSVEHHTCMVELLSHAGHFDKAMALIENMPSSNYIQVWLALLGACQKWGNVSIGKLSFEHVIVLDRKCRMAYFCMRDIFTDAGMQKDADKIDAMRLEHRAKNILDLAMVKFPCLDNT